MRADSEKMGKSRKKGYLFCVICDILEWINTNGFLRGERMLNFFKKSNEKQISIKELDELIGKINFIDIREPEEYMSGHVKTSKNIPMGQILQEPEKHLKKEETYYIMCLSGRRSANTCAKLQEMGYDVVDIAGGYSAYDGKHRCDCDKK